MQDTFDFNLPESNQPGFRLQHVEVLNWGTFHQRVWRLVLDGENTLLTGDIGSGKSTFVDAITTLLVPANRVAFNKAAGAEHKERSLRSYVLGYYKSERQEQHHSAKPVALRDAQSYSVILAVFHNENYGHTVTLAQVFWQRDTLGQPERFYVVADKALDIARDFADFGKEIKQLRKNLNKREHIELFDAFAPYGAAFKRRFGIQNEQALELFHQTVSMKSVGNLTDFVRSHMLEAFDIESRIAAMIHHFDDLSRAHEAVIKARNQFELLRPLMNDLDKYHTVTQEHAGFCAARDALEYYFSRIKKQLLDTQWLELKKEISLLDQKIYHRQDALRQKLITRDKLKQEISANGGDRLQRLAHDIAHEQRLKEKRQRRWEEYARLCKEAGFEAAVDEALFEKQRAGIASHLTRLSTEESEQQNRLTEQAVLMKQHKDQLDGLEAEIHSLKARKNNIHARQIALRDTLCADLGLDSEQMPFAGEQLRVREAETGFEGAAERLLHQFALSLLVPEHFYEQVSGWVNANNLRGRLVYYKVPANVAPQALDCQEHSLVEKIDIKPDSPFYDWLNQQLHKRFDYVCCDSIQDFHRHRQAITAQGQIKSQGQRHEKDDRHAIQDRSRYVLGWDNQAKLQALVQQQKALQLEIQSVADKIAALQQQQRHLSEQRAILLRLDGFHEFEDIHWQACALAIQTLEQEQRQLKESSNQLQVLAKHLETVEQAIEKAQSLLDQSRDKRSRLVERRESTETQLTACEETPQPENTAYEPQVRPFLDNYLKTHFSSLRVSIASCDKDQQKVRQKLQDKINTLSEKQRNTENRILKQMGDFCRDYPMETREMDASLESESDFRQLYQELKRDDIPRFEARFKTLLNENTIREIANFQSQLGREREQIKARIEKINQSLASIEFNPGRYIKLEAEDNPDREIRQFQQDLRECTAGSLSAEASFYSEAKFMQVKAIIERFKGREGASDIDKKWTRKVTDVRHWFVFAASECWIENQQEHERYSDSSGKSGGQKEKLAYTVLAASLAYQFGLEKGNRDAARSFRFVVIDEAFGRGSDDSAEYGLRLFQKLGLQLLVVTPLQKIHIIEPFIAHVGFVHNQDGRESMLRHLTIQEYQEEREAQGVS